MTVMRTHRSSKYFTISNETAQDQNLSFAALGLLTYCLSMPPNWEFNPKLIWKTRGLSRDKTYKCFDELIRNHKCIRIIKLNTKHPNLKGQISYEIFDDSSDCIKRIEELRLTSKDKIEHRDNFKLFFRHPEFRNPKGQYTIKDEVFYTPQTFEPKNKKTTTNKEVVVVEEKEVISRLYRYLKEKSDEWGEKWNIALTTLVKLGEKYGVKYLSDQVNYIAKQHQQALKDESIPHKKEKTKRVEKPEILLKIACQKNYAESDDE
jgi:hypothetical protein